MGAAQAQLIISEVDPTGSSASYAADWFELNQNTGASAVDIPQVGKWTTIPTLSAKAVPLTGVTSIAPGQFVVFIEDTGMTDSTLNANFINAWFGGTAPGGLIIGNYGGSGVGLKRKREMQSNIFDSTGTPVTGVTFGATTLGATLDNTAGIEWCHFSIKCCRRQWRFF